jgi:hypothetical protein
MAGGVTTMGKQELRELQRQTRILAEKRATELAGAFGTVWAIGTFAAVNTWPHLVPAWPWWGWALFVLGVPAALAFLTYRQMTRG